MAASKADMQSSSYARILSKYKPNLEPYEQLYKHLHTHGELSMQENDTSRTIAEYLRKISPDIDVRTPIGVTGVIGILENNSKTTSAKTILIRADMDALPVTEDTGLDYACTKTMKDTDGEIKPVMHACGHDMHVATALAAAETLTACQSEWCGTVIFLFQPGEERALGAKAMVDDGLYDPHKHACPIPDVVLAQHVLPFRTGTVATRFGSPMSAADSFEITIYGRGGHASMPHLTIDPLVVACHVVVRWQTIISREVPPAEIAVLTVGSLHSGSTEDVISDNATIKVNIRTVSPHWREHILESMKRVARLECEISQCPKEPVFNQTSQFPLTINDDKVMKTIREAFDTHFGDNHNGDMGNALASEDFSTLATAIDKPCCYWFFGGIDADLWREHEKKGTTGQIPGNHSPQFAPAIQPTMSTGVEAMTVAVLSLLLEESHQV